MATPTRTTTERGYGAEHQAERRRWQDLIDAGPVPCSRRESPNCTDTITTDDEWDLDHTDDRAGYRGPSCVPCNRSAGGRQAHQPMTIREW